MLAKKILGFEKIAFYAHINGLPGGYTPGTTGGKRGGIWYFIRVFCP
jgi:hypothetical protein